MNRLIAGIDRTNDIIGWIFAPLIAVLALVVVYDVLLRFFTGRPSDWVFDATTLIFGAHFMLLAAFTLRHRAHVEVDVVKRLASRRVQAILDILGYVLFFAPFMAVYIYYGFQFAERSWRFQETTSGIVDLPVYPIKMIMVGIGFLLALQAVALVLRAVQTAREG